jgi:peptide/nickel transport system substrate-binding protein
MRKAIDMAVDRNAISSRLLRGLGKPSGQVIAPVTFGYAADIKPTAFDARQAKELLAQTAYKGEKIVLQYPTNNLAFGQEVAQAIANYLGNIGVNIELQGMEYSAFFPLWANRKLNGIHLFAYGPSIMDADLILGSLYEKTGRLYWIDPQVQDLVQKQRAEADPAKRRALIGEIVKLSAQNLPYAPLYNEIHAYGIQNRVKWLPRPDERLYFQSAEIQ